MMFTNRLQKIQNFVRRDRNNNDRNYHVDNRNQNDLSIWLDLADPVDFWAAARWSVSTMRVRAKVAEGTIYLYFQRGPKTHWLRSPRPTA